MREMVVAMIYINVSQRAANGGFTRHLTTVWLEGGEQQRGVAMHPISNRGGAALLAEHGTRNHTKQYRPCKAFTAGPARVGNGGEGVEQTAILGGIHRRAPCAVWVHTRILDDGLGL